MRKQVVLYIFLLVVMLFAVACTKTTIQTDICLHNSSVDYLKRWAITYIETDNFNEHDVLIKRVIIHPNGYFQINNDFTYNRFSDDAPVNGKWNINTSCQFVLNPNTKEERQFSVTQLSVDSLTIVQTLNQKKII